MPVFAQSPPVALVEEARWQDNYIMAVSSPYAPNLPIPSGFEPTADGYCVSFVQAHGFEMYSGNADEWLPDSQVPQVGSAIILKEGRWLGADGKWHTGHLGLVIGIYGDKLWIVEQNYEGRWIVSFRTIDINYENIIGYKLLPDHSGF